MFDMMGVSRFRKISRDTQKGYELEQIFDMLHGWYDEKKGVLICKFLGKILVENQNVTEVNEIMAMEYLNIKEDHNIKLNFRINVSDEKQVKELEKLAYVSQYSEVT